MGEISRLWDTAKAKLSDPQKAKLPKLEFGKKCDEYEASCAKAVKAIKDANQAIWAAYTDGTMVSGGDSARAILAKIMTVSAANKDIDKLIGTDNITLDRKITGYMRGVLKEWDGVIQENVKAAKKTVAG